ncbi:CcmE/CycJ protein [Stappia sp. 22II-S9-Z10]|nr:CcmE/CycJ protein [Stappia sp. 22II-S9-Z10]
MTRRGRKARRLALIAVAGLAIAGAAALVLVGLGDRITYAATPTELKDEVHPAGVRVRLGGLVEDGSLVRGADGDVAFAVTDTVNRVPVRYTGILPDLFREGQGVVTEGVMDPSGTLMADTVLARHDENYMPKEVVDSLKAQGRWKEGEGARTGMEGRATTADATAPITNSAATQ